MCSLVVFQQKVLGNRVSSNCNWSSSPPLNCFCVSSGNLCCAGRLVLTSNKFSGSKSRWEKNETKRRGKFSCLALLLILCVFVSNLKVSGKCFQCIVQTTHNRTWKMIKRKSYSISEFLSNARRHFSLYTSVFQPFWGRGTQNDLKTKFAEPQPFLN